MLVWRAQFNFINLFTALIIIATILSAGTVSECTTWFKKAFFLSFHVFWSGSAGLIISSTYSSSHACNLHPMHMCKLTSPSKFYAQNDLFFSFLFFLGGGGGRFPCINCISLVPALFTFFSQAYSTHSLHSGFWSDVRVYGMSLTRFNLSQISLYKRSLVRMVFDHELMCRQS